jgi:uncharacterized membrane protein YfcA
MKTQGIIILIAIFSFTAFISVLTGGTSLITVPVMIQVGIEPHAAVATNMLTLIFLSLGGAMPFVTGAAISRERLPAMIGLTLIGSVLGAVLMVICFGMAFLEAVVATKLLNLVSSLVATIVFAQQRLISWTIGLVLGVVAFSGAAAGASIARKLSNRLLRRLFLTAVFLLGVKTLLYDPQW